MLSKIHKYEGREISNPLFTILIPSWNNLPFLKLCIESIRKHSEYQHQIIVVANAATDGTLEWLHESDLDFIHAEENVGICIGLNVCRSLIRTQYVAYFNDDMYALPGWDIPLWEEILRLKNESFMLSATLIEPKDFHNPCVIVQDHGDDLTTFDEAALLANFRNQTFYDWSGSTWPPVITGLDLWDLIGGMSIEFSPGMYSDPDLSMKAYFAGVRYFKGLGDSRVYHFGSKTTRRSKNNNGRSTFLQKWGISAASFMKGTLKRGSIFNEIKIPHSLVKNNLKDRLKRMWDNLTSR